ncbi:MAG: LamG-like jellyroll fold domain-containing protein [Verrucomicrobiota bacterium]
MRLGETGSVRTDSSGANRTFTSAFSTSSTGAGLGGQDSSVIVPTGVGGPLGAAGGPVSAISSRWGSLNTRTSGMWIEGPNGAVGVDQWNLPATNWVMECWLLPVENGTTKSSGSNQAIFVGAGSNNNGAQAGGLRFRIAPDLDVDGLPTGPQTIFLEDIAATQPHPLNTPESPRDPIPLRVGTPVPMDTTKWMHVAAVNDNGSVTFYVNGVASGTPVTGTSAPHGSPTIGSGPDTRLPFNGYLDEIRFSTFAPGAFTVSDLLLRPAGPAVLAQMPATLSVWEGGAAPFEVGIAYDETATYQWKLGGAPLPGATSAEYLLSSAAPANSAGVYSNAITSGGVTVTSSNATLTVVPVKTADTNFYRTSVQAEASLLAFFPVDGDTGTTVTNTKNAALNGTLAAGVSYDGRTDRSLGQRALRFKGNAGVDLPANATLEFPGGTGTIEAIVYLQPAGSQGEATLFSLADGDLSYYKVSAGLGGGSLTFTNDALEQAVTWSVPANLRNRFAHVAFTFSSVPPVAIGDPVTYAVTAYVDGESLGAKPFVSFGNNPGLPAHIGSAGLNGDELAQSPWQGTIDELAVYSTALPATTIAVHNSRFKFGTAVAPPEITTQPTGTRNLLAGGAPAFRVVSTGTAPLSYKWQRNGADISGNPTATTSTLVLNNSTAAMSGAYTVTVTNPQGSDSSDPFTVNFAAPPDTYSGFVLADNPTAYWRVNEASGTVMKDYAGGLDGTYSTTATLGTAAQASMAPDTALRLTATGTPISNATVPFTPVLNPSGAFSLECWVKPTASGDTARAVISAQNRNAGRSGYVLYQGLNAGAGWEVHLGVAESVKFIQSEVPAVAGRWDHVVITWNGSDTARLYVNGVEEATHVNATAAAAEQGPFRPNLEAPLEIGTRFGGGIPWDGTVDEIAFYNQALTLEQVRKHQSIAWVPATITQAPPATATALEAGNLTLTAQVSGFPNTYQWMKNGVALEVDAAHYPQGVTSPSLVIAGVVQADGGAYQLVITNPLGNQSTANTTVTFAADTSPPSVAYATGDGSLRRVRVGFNRAVTPETAGLAANYTLTGGLKVSSVVLTAGASVVDLILTSPMTPGATYGLSVSGVRDERINHNLIAANLTPFSGLSLTPGVLSLDFYGGITGNNVEDLKGDTQFPDGVYTSTTLTSFSTRALTGGDLATNPAYAALGLGGNYGTHVYGWITPAVSGNYTFFLNSDDGSELNLSTDSNPANADMIAYMSVCCTGWKEPAASVVETSSPIALVAGKSYYIEAYQKEGGGGDYLEVAWRLAGDTTAVGALQPIPASVLSGYATIPLVGMGQPVVANGQVAITWGGTGKLQQSDDLIIWADVSGNPVSPYVSPVAGRRFYRLAVP